MSHHTHVLLSNEETADGAALWVNDILSDRELAYQCCDSFAIEGILNLQTGEYEEGYRNGVEIDTIEKLETWANCLFSKAQYDELLKSLEVNIKNRYFWKAMEYCKELDGIVYAVEMGTKWTAKKPFPICDGYLDMCGITDWCGCTCVNTKDPAKFAVILDLHS